MVARVLDAAGRHLRVLERVAEVSRTAHHRSRDLEERIEALDRPVPIAARSAAMRRALEQAELVARHDTTVLLQGETGTGKEVLARLVHARSRRVRHPFVQVNCGALPEALVESELFGHERGAFTGAERRHAGRFERAQGGTLLLDEVGELPAPAQVKILRVLQERVFERVGGEETIPCDVRVIAATHRSLEAMVGAGKFRADLYYRLSVFPIPVPPLRERVEDLPHLVRDLTVSIAARLGRAPPEIEPELLAQVAAGAWPGNVRELENALERSMILAREGPLRLAGLPPQPGEVAPVAETLRESQSRTIETALHAARGRIYGPGGAAERLGTKPSTLQSKMKKLGLRRADYAGSREMKVES